MSRIHRDYPEASPAEIEAMQLAELARAHPPGGPMTDEERGRIEARQAEPKVEKTCRECGTTIEVPASKADSGSKWWNLCGSCIRHEC